MIIRKNIKMKVLSFILTVILLIGLTPATIFATPTQELWVNGVNILTVANNTVACGAGTATYDPATAMLTLNNAVIETAYNGIGICTDGANDSTNKLTIELVGVNKIATNEKNQVHAGIYSLGTVSIKGAGSLLIETATDSNSYVPHGIFAFSGCNIIDSKITIKDLSSYPVSFSSAIDINGGSLQIKNAIISIDNYMVGVNVPSGDVTVQGSRITVTKADCGIAGGEEIDNFLIQDSVLDFTGDGVTNVGLLNGHEIQIDNSLVKILSQNSNAIYTNGAISVRNGSVLEVMGYYPALFSTLDTRITDSKVSAISTADSGIYSRANIIIDGTADILTKGYWAGLNANGNITINNGKVNSTSSNDMGIYMRGIFTMNGGEVYAQGSPGFAAIGARYTMQEGDTDPVAKIIINSNYSEINRGKVSVSDWFAGISDGTPWTRSWSSFITGDDSNKLATDRSNALNQITIKMKPADYSKVDEAIAKIPTDLSKYTDGTTKAVNDAKNAVVRSKNITDQATVDGYATAIENAIKALVYKGADYSKVDEAIAKIPTDLSKYTDGTTKAVNDAKNAVVRGKDITEQATVDGYVAAIENAIKVLVYKGADYSKVDEAITKIPADLSKYTDETAKAVNDAKNAVVRGKDITEQATVDGYVAAIENAIKVLVYKGADYSKVDEAIAKIPTDLSKYTDGTTKAVNDAKNAVVRGKDITQQLTVDGYAAAIENAIKVLLYKGADYSKVDEAIAKIPTDLSKYTDGTTKAVNDAKNAVVRGKDITEQATVDGYVAAIENAIKALVYKGADYSKVDEAIAKIPADLSKYTDGTTKAVNDAKNAVVRGKNITEQATVDGYVAVIKNAVAALKLKPVDSTAPEIISGANQKVEQGNSATFTCNSDFNNFLKVLLDGKELSSDEYTVKEGSTIVSLNAEFIRTLDEGNHTLSIVSTDGQANTEFTVTKASKPTNTKAPEPTDTKTPEPTDVKEPEPTDVKEPQPTDTNIPRTGDHSHTVLVIGLMLFSGASVLGTMLYGKKRHTIK